MATFRPSFVVGIGGSAGGLSAYKAFLQAMPCNTGMAFVFVPHLLPEAISQLAEILSHHTEMRVMVALNAMLVRQDHVYVCPSNADLLLDSHTFKVVSPRTKRNVVVDLFFTSLAEAMGARAIGIVLSGSDGDGSEGCKQIKAKGGVTFAQDMTAEVSGMPLSAQATGCVDFVLPPEKIAAELQKMVKQFGK